MAARTTAVALAVIAVLASLLLAPPPASAGAVITSLAPATADMTVPVPVRVSGSGFLAGVESVSFGSTRASVFRVESDTLLVVESPIAPLPGAVALTVTFGDGTQASSGTTLFTFTAPTVTLDAVNPVTPSTGSMSGQTTVTIKGSGFVNVTKVLFGYREATFTVDSTSQITAKTPWNFPDTTVTVTVSAAGGQATTAGPVFTFFSVPPTLDSKSPVLPTKASVAGGESVTITGTDLQLTTTVRFGTTESPLVTVNSNTSITAQTPRMPPGPVTITVTTLGGSVTSSTPLITFGTVDTSTPETVPTDPALLGTEPPATILVGDTITPFVGIRVTSGDTDVVCTVGPVLPEGLVIDPATCVISGQALSPSPLQDYVVTATSAQRTETRTFSLSVSASDLADTTVAVPGVPETLGPIKVGRSTALAKLPRGAYGKVLLFSTPSRCIFKYQRGDCAVITFDLVTKSRKGKNLYNFKKPASVVIGCPKSACPRVKARGSRQQAEYRKYPLKVSLKVNGVYRKAKLAPPCRAPGARGTKKIVSKLARKRGYCMDVNAYGRAGGKLYRTVLFVEDPRLLTISRR